MLVIASCIAACEYLYRELLKYVKNDDDHNTAAGHCDNASAIDDVKHDNSEDDDNGDTYGDNNDEDNEYDNDVE